MFRRLLKYTFVFLLLGYLNYTMAQTSASYSDLIDRADTYFAKNDFYNAKATYQLALQLDSNADYPKKKIEVIIQKLNDELELRLVFEEKISAAELAYADKEYQKAILLYEEATVIIDYEEQPKLEVKRITKEWESIKNRQLDFEQLLIDAQTYKKNKDFTLAITKLEEANKLFPSKSDMLLEIAQLKLLLKQQNTKLNSFNHFLALADKYLAQSRFHDALKQYQEAETLFPEDEQLKKQLLSTRELIEIEDAYSIIIDKADAHYIALELEEAESAYKEAQKIWPKKAYPSNMLAKLEEARHRKSDALKRINPEYSNTIIAADKQFVNNNYEPAYDLYIKALNIKPYEDYPQRQIQKINKLLATGSIDLECEILENGNALSEIIIEIYENGNTEEIMVSDNGKHRLKLKLNSNYVLKFKREAYVHKIFTFDSHLPDTEDLNAVFLSQLSVELFPSCSIDLALFDKPLARIAFRSDSKKFDLEIKAYEEINKRALELKNECAKIFDEQRRLSEYEKFLARAVILARGVKDNNIEDYLSAILLYQKASDLYPEKEFSREQIALLNVLLEKEREYKNLVASGDSKYALGELNMALFDYYKAKNLKPKSTYPQEQIDAIDRILAVQNAEEEIYISQLKIADSLFDVKVWKEAIDQFIKVIDLKKDEKYPQNRLVEARRLFAIQNELDASYQEVIDEGDAYFEKQSFSKARTAYLKANRIKPDEQYPLYKIEDINTIVEQKDIRKTNTRYRELVTSADKLFSEKAYQVSLTQYTQASNLKPNEIYPPQQIAKIDQILTAQNELEAKYQQYIKSADSAFYLDKLSFARGEYVVAGEIKPTEDYPPQQIAMIDQVFTEQNELEAKYQQYIESADSAFYLDELNFAREVYVQAKELKPIEEYPVIQINKIDILLLVLNELEQNYQNAIARADSSFFEEQYGTAKDDYNLALTYKSTEAYPKQKIKEIDAILAQISDSEAAYQKAIDQGDQNFVLEHYLFALSYYEAALDIKKNEEYPQIKIAAIESILSKLDQQDKDYTQTLVKADDLYKDKQYEEALPFYKEALVIKPNEKYPPDQIYRINTILEEQFSFEESYINALGEGDKYFIEEKYQLAISSYQKANHLKPSEKYPIEQIAKIRDLLGASEREYHAFIKQGDNAYRLVIFQDAIVAYENALEIFPNEAYPRMMLDKIDAKIRRESVVNLVLTPEIVNSGVEKRYTFEPIDYRDRRDNYILIELKIIKDTRMRVFINFGKDNIKNGGYLVNLVQREGYTKYFVRIDRQLRWQNEDNNWISLLPEGGDLEVNRIQISREEKSN